jgi:hypothetical protein
VKNKRLPPSPKPTTLQPPLGILELERFSEESLHKWHKFSDNLNEFEDTLYHALEPERKRLRSELVESLSRQKPIPVKENNWVRIVPYKYGDAPLSSAGSLNGIGGRFNAGVELDANTMQAWPALYLAENYETAFREKFQLAKGEQVDGLSATELALDAGASHSCIQVNIDLSKVFDLTSAHALNDLCKIIAKFKTPHRVKELRQELRMPTNQALLVRTPANLLKTVCEFNWRSRPVQFGLPANSHILADWVIAAGYEAIIYQSSKGAGRCIAVFPEQLLDYSFVELADPSPAGVIFTRLDGDTAESLSGWDTVLTKFRSAKKK